MDRNWRSVWSTIFLVKAKKSGGGLVLANTSGSF